MKVYLNAGFGDPLGDATLGWIRDHGFTGVRQEVKHGDHARQRLEEIADANLDALILVGGGFMDWISFKDAVDLARHVRARRELQRSARSRTAGHAVARGPG